MKKSVVLFMVSVENLKTLKNHRFLKKQFFLLFAVSAKIKMKKYLKNKDQFRY